jgi:hypothetical protein
LIDRCVMRTANTAAVDNFCDMWMSRLRIH